MVYLGIQRGTQRMMYWSLRAIICFIMNACMSTTCKINGPSISHQLLNYLFSIVILVDWMTEMLGLSLWGYINFCVNLSTMHSFVPKYITYYDFVYTKKKMIIFQFTTFTTGDIYLPIHYKKILFQKSSKNTIPSIWHPLIKYDILAFPSTP